MHKETGGVDDQQKAARAAWIGLGVLTLPCMIYSMDLTVLNLAVPALARELDPTASQLLWIIDVYGFMVAGFLMVMGALGDRFGRRRVLLIGASAFGIGSVIAAFAQTAEQLIAARAVLGIAGATLAPSTLSLITSMFRNEGERTFAISIWVMGFSVGGIIGPIVGGLLIEFFWWGSVFLIAVPPMLLLLATGPFLLPEFRDETVRPIDLGSALLSLTAVLVAIYGIKSWAEHGLSATAGTTIVAGLCLAAIFVRRQFQLAHPMIDPGLFKSPEFTLSLSINVIAVFFMFGVFIFFAQYLQLVAGLSAFDAGLWSLPTAIAFAVASPFTAGLAERFTPVRLMTGGMLLASAGFVALALSSSLLAVVASGVVFCIGFTPVMALTTGFIVGAAPVEKAGVASAISETGSELGGALGVAMLGSLMTAIYRIKMQAVALPGLAAEDEDAARTSLPGAVAAARDLAEGGEAILLTARAAFLEAFHILSWLAAAAVFGLAIAAWRVLRHSPVKTEGNAPEGAG
jgi:DHA2 family multidrug resistance protein-like MFS transporter